MLHIDAAWGWEDNSAVRGIKEKTGFRRSVISHRLSFFILLVPIISVCLFAQQGVQPQITTPSLPQGQQGNIYGEAFHRDRRNGAL